MGQSHQFEGDYRFDNTSERVTEGSIQGHGTEFYHSWNRMTVSTAHTHWNLSKDTDSIGLRTY